MAKSPESKAERGPKRTQVDRLEQYLRIWEERMVFFRWMYKVQRFLAPEDHTFSELSGPLVHAHELRKHLLSLRNFDDFDFARFTRIPNRKTGTEDFDASVGVDSLFPGLLAQWTTASRRVYAPDSDLELTLLGTRFGEMKWEDVHFPFDSFGINLPVPIELTSIQDKKRKFDFMLVSVLEKEGFPKRLELSLFQEDFGGFKAVPKHELQRIEEKIIDGDDLRKIRELVKKYEEGTDRYMWRASTALDEPGKRIVDSYIQDSPDFDQVFRLAAGLCLYMSTLSKKTRARVGGWEKTPRRQAPTADQRAITDEAEVCTVSSGFSLSSEMRDALIRKYVRRQGGFEMPAGFVESYFRRKPGEGHDKEAPRSEHVNSYQRGFDRLPDDALPGGSQKDIK